MPILIRIIAVAVLLSCMSSAEAAGLFRAYLSSKGNDANDCSLVAPCRLLPRALSTVADRGEIWMLDSANYNTNTVTVTKSVTILAVPGVLGSVVAPSPDTNALLINGSNVVVTLRNLNIRDLNGQGTNNGILLTTASRLRIDNCEIFGVGTGVAILADGAQAEIINTAIHNTSNGVTASGATHVTVDGSHISFAGIAVEAAEGSRVTVSNSTLTENGIGILASSETKTATVVDVARSTISSTEDGSVGFLVIASVGLLTEIFVHSNTIHIGTGFAFAIAGGTEKILTYGDNRIVSYQANTLDGSVTPVSGI